MVLHEAFGIETGMMTTIHASTSSQKVLDGFSSKDIRSGECIVSGKCACAELQADLSWATLFPHPQEQHKQSSKSSPNSRANFTVRPPSILLRMRFKADGKGISIRVPVTNVSLVDLTVRLETPIASKDELINAFRLASAGPLAGVLRVSDEKLVSSDYLSSTESSIIDADATVMLDDRTCKIVAWYDNEYGFASRSKFSPPLV
jgi:glyceraldehyde 3-phosphate dehydrogenase